MRLCSSDLTVLTVADQGDVHLKCLYRDVAYLGHMLHVLNTSHIEIFSILCIQFVLCMGYPFMK